MEGSPREVKAKGGIRYPSGADPIAVRGIRRSRAATSAKGESGQRLERKKSRILENRAFGKCIVKKDTKRG